LSAAVTHFSQGMAADGTTVASIPVASDDGGSTPTADATLPPSEDSGTIVSGDSGPIGSDDSGPTQNEDAGAPFDSSAPANDASVPTDAGGPVGDGSACAVCANGFCEFVCPAGSTTCGSSTCVSTDSDPQNCGTCGHACTGTQMCVAGGCVEACNGSATISGCASGPTEDGAVDCSSCGVGYSACGNECTQTATDPQNCGTCGHACTQGQTCSGGTCNSLCVTGDVCAGGACLSACPTGQTVCGTVASNTTGSCTSTDTDPSNCGTCGHSCTDGQQCVAGSCVASCYGSAGIHSGCGSAPQSDGGVDCSSCGSGYSACGQQCTQLATDDFNCGTCGHACTQGQTCSAGSCTTLCTGTDVCSPGGVCLASCPTGSTVCDSLGSGATSVCNDLQSDSLNCGTCGHPCASGEACLSGVCIGSCNQAAADDAGTAGAPDSSTGSGSSSGGNGSSSGGNGGGDASGCVPLSCQPGQCGTVSDGCGGPLNCPPCSGDSGACTPIPEQKACSTVQCGNAPDGCGGFYPCTPCGDGGSGPADAGSGCVPATCQPGQCGTIDNGCGQELNCPACGQDAGKCSPISEQQACASFPCGQSAPDGCGGTIPCPACGASDAGASGDGGSCLTEQQACGAECGVEVPNGCGGDYECPSCGPADAGSCTPATCQPGQCGTFNNGCGQGLSCPACGQDAGTCTPISEQQACADFPCGQSSPDGCGGAIPCPACGGSDGGASDDAGCEPQNPQVVCAQPGACGQLVSLGCGAQTQCPSCDAGGSPSDSGGPVGSYGTPCTNAGGPDPACNNGEFPLCEVDGAQDICTKACTYAGPSGPVSDPADCPPPTSGLCTPKGFCK